MSDPRNTTIDGIVRNKLESIRQEKQIFYAALRDTIMS